jgi:F0F1-type ATP synthase membrane subunit b/b'
MTRRPGSVIALLAAAVLVAVSPALASEGEAGGAAETITVIFKWIHFAILAGLAYWLFIKVLPPAFRRSADSISSAITKATAAKLEAERRLKDAGAKFARLEQEVAEFRTQAQRDAAAELDRLRALTRQDEEKIHIAGKAEIEAAERAARMELKSLAARLAVDRAESLLAKELTPAVQENMISHFVESLQRRPN